MVEKAKYKVWVHITKVDPGEDDPGEATDILTMDEIGSFNSEQEAAAYVSRIRQFVNQRPPNN